MYSQKWRAPRSGGTSKPPVNHAKVLIEAALAFNQARNSREPNAAYQTRKRLIELAHALKQRKGSYKMGHFTEDRLMFLYENGTADIVTIPVGEHAAYVASLALIEQALNPETMMNLGAEPARY